MLVTDTAGASAYLNAIDHLRGPLQMGATDATVPIGADGIAHVTWTTREPLVVAVLSADLGATGLVVTPALAAGVAARALAPVEFAAWTPGGAPLPLAIPAIDPVSRTAQAFDVALTLERADASGVLTAVAPAAIAGLVEIHLLEGVAGRVAFLMLSEQARLRRTMRAIDAAGRIATAGGDALDRIGGELGMRRMTDRLVFDPVAKAIVPQPLTGGEADAAYARRLAAFRPFALPGTAGIASRLAAAGLPGFAFEESQAPFPVAVRVVALGAAAAPMRANFFAHVVAAYLTPLEATPAADAIVHARPVSPDVLASSDALRKRLAAGYGVPSQSAVAPFVADALDLAWSVRQTLLAPAAPAKLQIARGFDSTAGSRYELGLGVDVKLPAAAEVTALIAAVRANPVVTDPRVAGAVAAMAVALATGPADQAMSWFWNACGFRTAEALDAATVYLSTTAAGPLTIEGTASAPVVQTTLTAMRRTPDDATLDANLARSVAATLAAWTGAGHAAWTALAPADALAAWKAAVARPVSDPVGTVLAGAGLPAVANPAATASGLALVPADMVVTVKLAAADAALVIAHQVAAIGALRSLVVAAHAAGVSSLLVLTSATDVVVVFGARGLPGAGLNVGDRGAGAIRWFLVPLAPPREASLTPQGSACVIAGSSLLALAVAVSGARAGSLDPYEAAVVLPPATLLDVGSYELAMNVLAHSCPIGVLVNTWDLRQNHVDLSGSGTATPVPPEYVSNYRAYRRKRYLGAKPPAFPAP